MNINEIKTLLESGKTCQELGKLLGVTRQRIHQIVQKHKLFDSRKEYGASLKAKQKRQTKQELLVETYGREVWRLDDLERAQHSRFMRKRQNAKNTGYEWNLEFKDLVWPKYCPILGLKLDYFTSVVSEQSPSFDRIDNNIGYVKGNVQIISWRANRIKNNGTAEEHRKIANYLDEISIGWKQIKK